MKPNWDCREIRQSQFERFIIGDLLKSVTEFSLHAMH